MVDGAFASWLRGSREADSTGIAEHSAADKTRVAMVDRIEGRILTVASLETMWMSRLGENGDSLSNFVLHNR